jgi:hypothetical protein
LWVIESLAGRIPLYRLFLRVGPSVSPEHPIPKKVNYCEVRIRVAMMDEMERLLAPKPRETLKS